jgi:hypothetical protein
MRGLRSSVALLLLPGLAALGGCGGSSDMPPLGVVTGKVLLDGKPEEGIKVFFDSQVSARSAIGETDKEGKYTLFYAKDVKGAPVGKCKVKFDQPMQPEKGIHFSKLPRKYFMEPQFEKDVAKGPNEFNFELSSQGALDTPLVTP